MSITVKKFKDMLEKDLEEDRNIRAIGLKRNGNNKEEWAHRIE